MKNLKVIVAAVAMVLSTGCASQSSVYVDRSTPEQRDVRATGAAAVEAARSNSSQNVNIEASRGVSVQSSSGGRYSAGTQYQRNQPSNSYSGYATDRISSEFDWRMKQKINTKVRGLMNDLFD